MAYIGNETSNLDITVRQYYDKLFLMRLEKNLELYQFCEKKPLPANSGKAIYWNRLTNFSEATTALTEGVTPTVVQTSATAVSATIKLYGAVTQTSDLLDMTSINDNVKEIIAAQSYQAQRTIDTLIRFEIYNTATTSAVPISANVFNQFYYGGTYGNLSAMPGASCRMATPVIREAVTKLRNNDVSPIVGNDYIMIVNPTTGARLRADTTWLNTNQYSGVYAEKIFAGECGRIEGARIIESTNIPFFASSTAGNVFVSSAEVSAYFSILLGKGSVGVSELDGGLKTFSVTGADKADPLNQASSYGWKMSFVPKVLNYSCAVVVATTD